MNYFWFSFWYFVFQQRYYHLWKSDMLEHIAEDQLGRSTLLNIFACKHRKLMNRSVCLYVCLSVSHKILNCWFLPTLVSMYTCTCTSKRESEKERDGKNNFFNFLIFSILIFSTLKKSIVLLFYCYMGLRPAHVPL